MSDALGTAQPPNPAAAAERGKFGKSEEPPAYASADQVETLRKDLADLARLVVNSTEPDPPTGVASGNTNADGMAFIPIYQVAEGEHFRLHRAVVECQGYSPASPYTNNAGWLGLYAVDENAAPSTYTAINDTLQGALKDFAPATSGGPIFPALFTDNSMQASEIRGPKYLVLVIFTGPASKRITVNYQGSLRRTRGIV